VQYFNSTSKKSTSLIKLATHYFASKLRTFETNPHAGYKDQWKMDEEVKLVTEYLTYLKYDWNLKNIDKKKNVYSLTLQNETKDFLISQASSGEKEIINFLLGIFAFNIKHGLIIIDEPELHLHPKWQTALIDLFLLISIPSNTDNQFLLSTHSPMFINNKTVANTIRVFKDAENSSNTVHVKKKSLGTARDLLHIVNTHNNQKIFFADKVILVEGVHDRIVFERLVQYVGKNISEVIEVVEVHSNSNFDKYRKFLNIFKVENYIFADRDYLHEKGNLQVKALFVQNHKRITTNVLNNKKSKDRVTLSDKIEQAISTDNKEGLKEVWDYIKARNVTIKDKLTQEEKKALKENIDQLQSDEFILILKEGEIEDYLPDGYKKLDKTIELLKEGKFNDWVKRKKTDKRLSELFKKVEYVLKNE